MHEEKKRDCLHQYHLTHTRIQHTHTKQWHVKFAFNYTSQGLIDPMASYFAEIITGASAGIAYKIKGKEGGRERGQGG